MFSSIGLFSPLECPAQGKCKLPNCIFSHLPIVQSTILSTYVSSNQNAKLEDVSISDSLDSGLPRKKRRVSHELEFNQSSEELSVKNTQPPEPQRLSKDKPSSATHHSQRAFVQFKAPESTTRTINPPSLQHNRREPIKPAKFGTKPLVNEDEQKKTESRRTKSTKGPTEPLNPRLVPSAPASHTMRLKLVTLIHEQVTRLNKEVQASDDPSKDALELCPQEMITAVLDEEQRIAKENNAVYSNVMKLRIGALKKMKLNGWKKERLMQLATEIPNKVPQSLVQPPVMIDTGLKPEEEIALLPKLVASQDHLAKHGYVPIMPSNIEVETARQGVEAGQGWEQCDRCKSRFQVFPGRREEDGALTTGGSCHYHHGKPVRPVRQKADTGHKEATYSCCTQLLGTPGCTTADSHVFKVSEAKRLALILPFMETPNKDSDDLSNAVCFDCEMGYTTMGMELIRLTATSWPNGTELLDVLVRPIGEILDLNSRFSGVWPRHFNDAIEYKADSKDVENEVKGSETSLRLVDSPSKARELLFKHLTAATPLMGHALENDLNAVRVIHPTIVDTVLLYPHPRGLPIRFGLKVLAKKHLNRDIQTGGAQGHDSKEDANAAGDLIRLKVMETWKAMTKEGWMVNDGVFFPPLPGGPQLIGTPILGPGGLKRKRV